MTAAHREAGLVVCPDCRQPKGVRCVWPDGRERKTPCLARLIAAERYDGADPSGSANSAGFDPQAVTQLDSELSQRDITEPLHGRDE